MTLKRTKLKKCHGPISILRTASKTGTKKATSKHINTGYTGSLLHAVTFLELWDRQFAKLTMSYRKEH